MSPESSGNDRKATIGNLVFSIAFELAFPTLLMWVSNNWLWAEGWFFSIWFVLMCLPLTIWLFIKNPSLFLERVKPAKGNQKPWDRIFVSLLMVLYISWIVVMPFDASRLHWSPMFPVWLEVVGGAMLLISSFLFIKCYIDNPYLSAVVRIQDDRGQEVISTGVYSFVRHPMYLAGALLFVGAPLLFGSLVGLGFAVVFIFGFVYRIFGEEKMLEQELQGYVDYKKKVRFRIIPFIW